MRRRTMGQEKGSMAVFVGIVLLSMLFIVMSLFLTSNNSLQSQAESLIKIKEAYEADVNNVDEIYGELVASMEPEQKLYEFSYTSAEQSFTVPATGRYKLQVWGAQGGQKNANYGTGGKRRIFRR